MNEKEKKILDVFGVLLPSLTEAEQEKLLAFGEGMVSMLLILQQKPASRAG